MAISSRVGGESWSNQHSCHRGVRLQSTELGLWPGADSDSLTILAIRRFWLIDQSPRLEVGTAWFALQCSTLISLWDQTVVMFDMLRCIVLCLNRDRVQSVVYAAESKQLLSAGDDAVVVFWNVDVKRQEVFMCYGHLHGTSNIATFWLK